MAGEHVPEILVVVRAVADLEAQVRRVLEAVGLARFLDLGATLGGEAVGDGLGRLDQAVLVGVARRDAADRAVGEWLGAVGAVVADVVAIVKQNLLELVLALIGEGAAPGGGDLAGGGGDNHGVGDLLGERLHPWSGSCLSR